MSILWKTAILFGLLAVPVVACASEPAQTPAAAPADAGASSEEPFVIGALDSLTGIGESYGVPFSQSKLLAMEEINAAGGINGRMLKVVVEDSKCTANDAILAYRRLTDVEGAKIILGTSCSSGTLGVAPLAEKDGVVLLSSSATNPDITYAGDYVFRTAISSIQVGADIGNTLWAEGARTVATITESTDYVEGVRRTVAAQFEELGGSVAASESYPSDAIDFRSMLTKLFAKDPDAIFVGAQNEIAGGTVVKQARELGYDGPIYSEVVTTGANALGIAGEAAAGLKAVVPNPDLQTAVGKDFLANFEARYGVVAAWPWFQGSAYDGVYIAAECLRQTNDDQDAEGFRDCLYDLTWSGAIGDAYGFDENGDIAGVSHVVIEVLPLAERTTENLGYRILGPPPTP